MRKKAGIILVCLCFSCFTLPAQILDDSTANVYDASSITYTTLEQIKYNQNRYFPLDTTLERIHRFGMVDSHNNLLQNLGNLGTALNPVFFTPPAIIGRTAGFPVYDLYFEVPNQTRYYDAKTPYSKVKAIFAGNQRNIIDVGYTRNITPLWNAGFSFKRINADKQLAREVQSNRQSFSTYYDLFTFFRSNDDRYNLLAKVARLNHEIREPGGIDEEQNAGFGQENFFLYEDSYVLLNNARSREYRFDFHLYHHYQLLNRNIQLYHELNTNTQKNTYTDATLNSNLDFYDQILMRTDSTLDEFKFRELTNEAGFKGEVENFFYSFFYKRRTTDFHRKYLGRDDPNTENSGGFYLRFTFDSLHYLQTNGEYLLGGEHLLEATYKNKFLEARYKRIKSLPTYIQEAYFGNHGEWYNNFRPPQSDNLYGAIEVQLPKIRIKPFLNFSSVFNHIFFNQDQEPAQIGGFAQIWSPGLELDINPIRHVYWENKAIYTLVSGSSRESFRYPELFINSSLYYKNFWFGEKLLVKFGVDAHYFSPYLAPAYSPYLQNFYLQDDFWVPKRLQGEHYAAVNAFLNFKIGNVRFFFRMEHLNQADYDGYFVSPLLSAQKRTLNFGVYWMFFD